MHTFTLKSDTFTMSGKQTYHKGDTFLIDDGSVAPVLGAEVEVHTGDGIPRTLGSCAFVNHVDWPEEKSRLDPKADYDGKRVLLMRPGGFGDLLFLTPLIYEIRSRWPSVFLAVACMEHYRPVLQGNADIDELLLCPLPVEPNWRDAWDVIVTFEGVIETSAKARVNHACDCIADHAGLPLRNLPTMVYTVGWRDRDRAEVFMQQHSICKDRPLIAIQASASSECRSWPAKHNTVLARQLAAMGWQVLLFAEPGALFLKEQIPGVLCLPSLPDAPDFRLSCAILEKCDLLIGPDSSLAHVAGALEVPCIALHAAFPGDLRHRYHETTVVMEGKGDCGPCFHHKKWAQPWPAGGPCNLAGMCVLMAMIQPEAVAAKAVEMLKAKGKA